MQVPAGRGLIDVLIPDMVVDAIRQRIRSASHRNEQGGLLLGYRKGDAIQIESATFPGLWDHGSPTIFHRSEHGHRVRALREWMRSGRTIDWVGEWHTHPGGVAKPSFTDRRTWARLAKHTGTPMVFLIFSDAEMYVGLQVPRAMFVKQLNAVDQGGNAHLFA